MTQDVWIMPTMDCEPPKPTVSDHANQKSKTGPTSWAESERAIRGYVERTAEHGFVPTLFVHPEAADYHRELFLDLQQNGVCLGLHLHPYKFRDHYLHDLGAYPEPEQRAMITDALAEWERALGTHPEYFRSGWLSGNDSTFGILEDLGFKGGSVSAPGRVNPAAAVAWVGAEPHPHRGHRGFRLLAGDSEYIEVPYLGDFNRPTHTSEFASDRGYETVYLSAPDLEGDIHESALERDRAQVTRNLIERFTVDKPTVPTLVPNTHNNMDYSDPDHPAVENLDTVARALARCEDEFDVVTHEATIETVVTEFVASE